MNSSLNNPTSSADEQPADPAPYPSRARAPRLPSARAGALLAAAMLGLGAAVGAAIGPAPASSIADSTKLPALIASLAARQQSAAVPPTSVPPAQPPTTVPQATPATVVPSTPASTTSAAAGKASSPAAGETAPAASTPTKKAATKTALPPITSVWLIQLSGVSFSEALAKPTAAPYISGQLIPKATLLSGWSALQGSAFASDAALAEHRSAVGGPPPLLHSIVQPACPEGAAGAGCAAGTPGELTAADEFLKAALATVTATSTYSEHGLVVVTFATVGIATSSELPPGATNATLTSQPPAGVALLSPFANPGARSSTTFNPTSPQQSLEKLLH
jgi:hypothetical protein